MKCKNLLVLSLCAPALLFALCGSAGGVPDDDRVPSSNSRIETHAAHVSPWLSVLTCWATHRHSLMGWLQHAHGGR